MKSGYLLINKPKDWTSFDVVKKTSNILKTKKVGHLGTLDPFATGLLILLIGKATRILEYIISFDKEYIVKSKFGITTDTADITGNIIKEEVPLKISKDDFKNRIPDICKITKQVPPNFSAIKINGQKAYNLARKGVDFVIPERSIKIKDFELLNYEFPEFCWRIIVSKGTYIRSITEQIASLFCTIATTIDLQRTKVGTYRLDDSITIDKLMENTPILPLDDLLSFMGKIDINEVEMRMFLNGQNQKIKAVNPPTVFNEYDRLYRVYYNNKFLGIAEIINDVNSEIIIKPNKVLYDE